MTYNLKLSLELNENDLDALVHLLEKREVVAKFVAGDDVREEVRISDVLTIIAESLASTDAGAKILKIGKSC